MDSYSQFTVHYDTQQRNIKPETRTQQRVEVPSSWYGVKPGHGGSYRLETRSVTVLGTVEVAYYGRRRVEYGKCSFQGHIVKVVKDSTNWKAVSREPISGCIA
jgi:hypothetical protein